MHGSRFTAFTEEPPLKRSGRPGYIQGQPLRWRTSNASAVATVIPGLTQTSRGLCCAFGLSCPPAGSEVNTILFGRNAATSCRLRLDSRYALTALVRPVVISIKADQTSFLPFFVYSFLPFLFTFSLWRASTPQQRCQQLREEIDQVCAMHKV